MSGSTTGQSYSPGGHSGSGFGGSQNPLITNSPHAWLLQNDYLNPDRSGSAADLNVGSMTSLSDALRAQGGDQWKRYQSLYQPVEQQMVNDAMNIDSAANQERVAGEVGAQVRSSVQKAKESSAREMAGMGINPNSGRAESLNKQTDMQAAAAEAAGMNAGRQAVKDQGIVLRTGVVGQGNTVANNSTLNNQTALSGFGAAGNLDLGNFNAGTSAFNANTNAGTARSEQTHQMTQDIIDNISGGMSGGMGSSKKIKEDKKTVSDEATLEKIKKIPVAAWKYKKGEGDGGRHIGAYAEDVNKQFGDKAAPKGKMIDIISMHGITLSAVKGLAKQVDELAASVKSINAKAGAA